MPALPTRILGRTGLPVTGLGFGALELRGMVAGVGRPLLPGQPERMLNATLDAGLNYSDVAVCRLGQPHCPDGHGPVGRQYRQMVRRPATTMWE